MKYFTKYDHRVNTLLHRIQTFPLFLLNLSMGKRLFIVLFSYGVGIAGLWFFWPQLNNAASMILPILCFCWFFSYRGLLISLFATVIAVAVIYRYLGGYTLPVQNVMERGIVGLAITTLLGLAICWLRTALDLVHEARLQALMAEQKRLLALAGERQITINYEQQRRINELKDQFLLNVSHELRTPLTVLGGSLEMLKEYDGILTEAQRAEMLKQALESQGALADLINRVLEITAAVSELPQAKAEAVSLHQLVQEVLAQQPSEEVAAYTMQLLVPEELIVRADVRLLRQVLQNLLSNVFKYVPKQTEIHIEAAQETPAAPVRLSIQDAGPGIPAEELPLLFERFVRLKRDLAGTTRGMGLGLYISRCFVEAMNGQIWVESSGRAGEGSRFCLTLPPFLPA